VIPAV